MKNKTCIIILGPTAVGKTKVALQLARHFSTQIISADSRQCFTELNIGVAKPSEEELKSAHHYFINSHSINNEVNAAVFEQYALQSIQTIFSKNDYAVMVGGTGLYIKVFCEGLDEIPPTPDSIRLQITEGYREFGITWLQQQIQQHDPIFYSKGEMENPQRMMRALEVVLATSQSIFSFRNNRKKTRGFNIVKIGLEAPRAILYQKINERVDEMMKSGLADEVKNLISFKNLNALQTVGYREVFDFFENKYSLNEAVEKIKQNTRHYAKRQVTWFKKDDTVHWINPFEASTMPQILNLVTT